jgi:hypothetical protein
LAVATISAAIFPPAPGRFSTTDVDAHGFRHFSRDDACGDVSGAAGSEADKKTNRATGKGFRCRCIVSKAGDEQGKYR